MNDNKFHFQIPKENIRIEKYTKRGFGRPYIRPDYYEHGEKLLTQYEQLYDTESTKVDFDLSSQLFFYVEIPADREIKSEKLKLQNLGIQLISYSEKNASKGTAYVPKLKYDDLISKIRNYSQSETHTGKSNISIIENIKPIDVQSKLSELDLVGEQTLPIIFSLFSTLPNTDKEEIMNNLIENIKGQATKFSSRIFGNGLCVVSCEIKANRVKDVVERYSSIEEVKYNSISIIPTALPVMHSLPKTLKVENPISNSTICIIDSSVNRHSSIFNNLITKTQTHLPSGSIYPAYDHGTFVASRCLFGDHLEDCLDTGVLNPYCKIMNVQVFGKDASGGLVGHRIIDLMAIIEDVVIDNHKTVRVYNLSIGNDTCIEDGIFSRFAKLLDYLTKKHKVLFVVACGNIGELQGSYPMSHFTGPLSRINSPAESLLSITVGSIAKYIDPAALALYHEISPFSRVGPGADGGIKPEVVAHGGNLLSTYRKSPRLGVFGISADGSGLCVDNGTSYAAPVIAQYAQQIFDVYPKSNPNLVKSLLYHFSEARGVPKVIITNPKHYVGFGEPVIDLATQAGDHNAAFIYEGKLDQDNYQYVKFHVPKSLAEQSQDSKLEIRITITYDPSVNVNNDQEYSQSRISAALFKPTLDGMKEISISDESTYSIPWNPIIHFQKSFTRSYLTGSWELRLRLYTRGELPSSYKQDYAVTIEILDSQRKLDVYSEIFHDYGSIYKRFKLRIAA